MSTREIIQQQGQENKDGKKNKYSNTSNFKLQRLHTGLPERI